MTAGNNGLGMVKNDFTLLKYYSRICSKNDQPLKLTCLFGWPQDDVELTINIMCSNSTKVAELYRDALVSRGTSNRDAETNLRSSKLLHKKFQRR